MLSSPLSFITLARHQWDRGDRHLATAEERITGGLDRGKEFAEAALEIAQFRQNGSDLIVNRREPAA